MHPFILKSSIAGLCLMALGTTAHAQSAQNGEINFTGIISPVTCVLSADSRSQRINFDTVPPNATGFVTGGTGGTDPVAVGNVAQPAYSKMINITLENCTTGGTGASAQPTAARVRITGPVNTAGRLSTSNRTTDIQLLQNGSTTEVWNLNESSANVTLTAGTNRMSFLSRYYVAEAPLAVGTANANAVFNMEYQ